MTEALDFEVLSDEALGKLSDQQAKAEFARSEAEGSGDFDLDPVVPEDRGVPVVASYDVVVPEMTDETFRKVQGDIRAVTTAEVRKLSEGLSLSPRESSLAIRAEGSRIEAALQGLLGTTAINGKPGHAPA